MDYDLSGRPFVFFLQALSVSVYVTRALCVYNTFVLLSTRDVLYDRYLAKNEAQCSHSSGDDGITFRNRRCKMHFICSGQPAVSFFRFLRRSYRCPTSSWLMTVHCRFRPRARQLEDSRSTAQMQNCPNFRKSVSVSPTSSSRISRYSETWGVQAATLFTRHSQRETWIVLVT